MVTGSVNSDIKQAIGKQRPTRELELKDRVRELSDLTDALLMRVGELIGSRKVFGRAFVYDGMDYCKVVLHEMA